MRGPAALSALLDRIQQTRVLVVGDAMLDRYWYGGVERISPEAPVPVVAVGKAEERPGGAANVAANVAALGAHCRLVCASGDDSAAESLAQLVKASGVEGHLLRDKLVNTTVKLRVVSRNQQLLRIDFETQVSKDLRARILATFVEQLPGCDVVIVSDYAKGGAAHIEEMMRAARAAGVPVLIDPKGDDYRPYRGAAVVTPNRKEFEQAAGRFRDNDELAQRARKMIEELDLQAVLVTRSEEGMSLIERNGEATHVPTHAREVYDVTGAGDTVIATLAAAYAAKASLRDAIVLANIAAGIVVGKLGAVAVTRDELRHALESAA